MAMIPVTHLPELLQAAIVALVRRDEPDLSCRHLAVLLICYLESEPHTVRDLETRLVAENHTLTRCLDRLVQYELVARIRDSNDRRIVLINRTPAGRAFVAELQRIMATAAADRGLSP